ncbi:MAG TPA: GTPase, partial [Candidatus Norongarragalinales archaeon]|nr:GTPase [Candidatus Norongarragalinales archaeon]
MLIGLVGPPNVGKSTFLAAATGANVQIANYPFTTIDPNKGVGFATGKCPHPDFGLPFCNARGGCENGVRKIPVNLMDVAGLVPEAHLGKGKGIEFLGDLSAADALLLVVDASGATTTEGVFKEPGTQSTVAQAD